MDNIIAHLSDTHVQKYKNTFSKESAQAKRRKETLERYKKSRDSEISRARKILQFEDDNLSLDSDNGEKAELETPPLSDEDEMEIKSDIKTKPEDDSTINQSLDSNQSQTQNTSTPVKANYSFNSQSFKNRTKFSGRLMTNEWLRDRPKDLENWYFMPCPKGSRSLVIASNGSTKAYNNKGYFRTQFQSKIPNGSDIKKVKLPHHTVLDCVLNFKTKTCYVLDVIIWKSYHYCHCTVDFRQFQKQIFFNELMIDYSEEQKRQMEEKHEWKIEPLKAFCCEENNVDVDMAKEYYNLVSWNLDGILVYHKEGLYYPCGPEQETYPLFGWLKKERMQELLGFECNFENKNMN